MSHSESNDASDIFWPGYVDAIANLAINLLFVIAVMSIVVLGATLQMATMSKTKPVNNSPPTEKTASQPEKSGKGEQKQPDSAAKAAAEKAAAAKAAAEKLAAEKAAAEKLAAERAAALAKLERELKAAAEKLAAEKAALAKALAGKVAAEKLGAEKAEALGKLEAELKAASEKLAAEKAALAKALADKAGAEKMGAEKAEALAKLEREFKAATEKLAAEKAAQAKALAAVNDGEDADKAALAKALAGKAAAEKLAAEKAEALARLERELKAAADKLAAEKAALAKALAGKAAAEKLVADAAAGVAPTLERTETVTASQKRVSATRPNQLQPISGGVVVAFGADVVELADAEAAELIVKMASFGPVKTSNWRIQVISPKGFSEAVRIAYYRVNAVRNVLFKQGVPSSAIEMRVTESEQSGANNARVLVSIVK